MAALDAVASDAEVAACIDIVAKYVAELPERCE